MKHGYLKLKKFVVVIQHKNVPFNLKHLKWHIIMQKFWYFSGPIFFKIIQFGQMRHKGFDFVKHA